MATSRKHVEQLIAAHNAYGLLLLEPDDLSGIHPRLREVVDAIRSQDFGVMRSLASTLNDPASGWLGSAASARNLDDAWKAVRALAGIRERKPRPRLVTALSGGCDADTCTSSSDDDCVRPSRGRSRGDEAFSGGV